MQNRVTLAGLEKNLSHVPSANKAEVKKGIRNAQANIKKLEGDLKGVRAAIDSLGPKINAAIDAGRKAGVSVGKLFEAAGLEDPTSVKGDLDAFIRELKMKDDLPDDLRWEVDALENKAPKDLDIDEKKLLEEAEAEVEEDLKKHSKDAADHADDADKAVTKGAKEVVEGGSEKGFKRVLRWFGRKLGSTLPGGGVAGSIVLAPEDQSSAETAVRAVASEIGVGPIDLDLGIDLGQAVFEGAQRRAEWEINETIRLEKKGWSYSAIAGHVNRGSKW